MAEILPAILTDTVDRYRALADRVSSFASSAHLDLADGTLVPSRTVSARDIESHPPSVPYEVHCMILDPTPYLDALLAARPTRLLLHLGIPNLPDHLSQIRARGVEAGIVVDPSTLDDDLDPYLRLVDQVSFVAVTPGAQGGRLVEAVVAAARAFHIAHPHVPVELDGGIKLGNLDLIRPVAAERYAIGSGIWATTNPEQTYRQFVDKL